MSVIRPAFFARFQIETAERWAVALLLCLGLSTALTSIVCAATASGEEQTWASKALVRVQFKRKVPAVVYQDKLIPEAAVLEVSEFPGIVADPRGYIVSYIGSTWTDLGNSEPQVQIRLSDGDECPAEFVGIDERVSLAVLRSQGVAKRAVIFGSLEDAKTLNLTALPEIGAGADQSTFVSVSGDRQSASVGNWIVSPFDVLQLTDSDIAPEKQIRVRMKKNLGGAAETVGAPLLDDSGRFFGFVIGSEKAGLIQSTKLLRVIGVKATRTSLNEVVTRGSSIRAGWLGVWLDDTTDRGKIQKVVNGGPADRAGLQDGDLILKLGDSTVWSKSSLVRLLRWETPGTKIPLTIERNGERLTIPVELGPWPVTSSPKFAWAIQLPKVWTPGPSGAESQVQNLRMYPVPVDAPVKLGLAVEPLTEQLAQYFHVSAGKGLLVTSVLGASPADRFGFRAGDVVTRINGQEVESARDIRKVIDASKDGVLVINFVRDGDLRTCKVVLQ